MKPKTSITWYVARNHIGRFSCGQNQHGDTHWTDDLVDARFHETIGPVKAAVTKWVKRHPKLPIPEILEWTIDIETAKVVDVAGETQKRIERARKVKEADERREKMKMLEDLDRQEKVIAERRRYLEGKT